MVGPYGYTSRFLNAWFWIDKGEWGASSYQSGGCGEWGGESNDQATRRGEGESEGEGEGQGKTSNAQTEWQTGRRGRTTQRINEQVRRLTTRLMYPYIHCPLIFIFTHHHSTLSHFIISFNSTPFHSISLHIIRFNITISLFHCHLSTIINPRHSQDVLSLSRCWSQLCRRETDWREVWRSYWAAEQLSRVSLINSIDSYII